MYITIDFSHVNFSMILSNTATYLLEIDNSTNEGDSLVSVASATLANNNVSNVVVSNGNHMSVVSGDAFLYAIISFIDS